MNFFYSSAFIEDPICVVFLLCSRDGADSRHTKIKEERERQREQACSQVGLLVEGIDVNMCNYNLCDWCYNVGCYNMATLGRVKS